MVPTIPIIKNVIFNDDNTFNALIDDPRNQLKYLKLMNIKHKYIFQY
jgi:hypothetical protein